MNKKQTVPPKLESAKLGFGKIATDHMVTINHDQERGWEAPHLIPLAPIQLHPFNSSLHYGLCAFEGMKAFKGRDGRVRLFRPMENMKRFLASSQRLAFPDFDPQELLGVIEEFVRVEQDWIPGPDQGSLYLRPIAFSMTDILGVHRAPDTMIAIMASPVGSYFSGKINLSVYEDYWRGHPRSAAAYKIGANYSPTVLIGEDLAKRGFSQAVWVFNECFLESGATNLFFLIENDKGKLELITHPLDGSILPGVTRDSIIQLTPDLFPEIQVIQRPFSIPEFIDLYRKGRVREVFVSGTASVIGEVHSLEIRSSLFEMSYTDASKLYCSRIKQRLIDIQLGVVQHPFAHLVK